MQLEFVANEIVMYESWLNRFIKNEYRQRIIEKGAAVPVGIKPAESLLLNNYR